MSVRVYSEYLSAFGADRAKALYDEGVLEAIYVKLHPLDAAALSNKAEWAVFRAKGIPLWGWIVCSADQRADVAAVQDLDSEFQPVGWLANIEKILEGADLSVLCSGLKALGKPLVASLAGANPNHHLYDHRSLDRAGFAQEWQGYADSNEGPDPQTAVRELYKPGLVFPGAEYRSRIRTTYGWGQVTSCWFSTGRYEAYKFPGLGEYEFAVRGEDWGWTVLGRKFDLVNGLLLGLAPYSKIRVAIISDDIARDKTGTVRTAEEWTAWAASARSPGLARRGVSVYLGERCSDEVLRAIAKGAG